MPTITVIDGANTSQTINTLPPVGAAAKAAALPVTIATDDPIVVSSANTAAQAANVAVQTANTSAQVANVSVQVANTAAQTANVVTGIGAPGDTAYANTTGAATGSVIGLLKGAYVSLVSIINRLPLGPQTYSGSLSVTPSTDQDPIFDHGNGVKITANTTSQILITPPANAKFLRVSCDNDIFVNTANATATDNGSAIHVLANSPEIIPVTPQLAVRGISANTTSVVRLTPMKTRP